MSNLNKYPECEQIISKDTTDSIHFPSLGIIGVITVVFALLYGIFAGIMAYSVNGRVLLDATIILCNDLGLDPTNVEQIEVALQNENFTKYISLVRQEMHANWYIVRHASIALLSLLVFVALLRQRPSALKYLGILAISMPVSMVIIVFTSPTFAPGGIGMILSSSLGGIFWAMLWWVNRRRLKRVLCR